MRGCAAASGREGADIPIHLVAEGKKHKGVRACMCAKTEFRLRSFADAQMRVWMRRCAKS